MHAMRMSFEVNPNIRGKNPTNDVVQATAVIMVSGLLKKTVQVQGLTDSGVVLQGSITDNGNGSFNWFDIATLTVDGLYPVVIPDGLPAPLTTHEPSLKALRFIPITPDIPPPGGVILLPPDFRAYFCAIWMGPGLYLERNISYE